MVSPTVDPQGRPTVQPGTSPGARTSGTDVVEVGAADVVVAVGAAVVGGEAVEVVVVGAAIGSAEEGPSSAYAAIPSITPAKTTKARRPGFIPDGPEGRWADHRSDSEAHRATPADPTSR